MPDPSDFFAPPAFKPAEALQRLQRELRGLGLSERAGTFERRGVAWVQAKVGPDVLDVALARAASRSPQWQPRTLKDSAQLRDFIAAVKQHLAQHEDDRAE